MFFSIKFLRTRLYVKRNVINTVLQAKFERFAGAETSDILEEKNVQHRTP